MCELVKHFGLLIGLLVTSFSWPASQQQTFVCVFYQGTKDERQLLSSHFVISYPIHYRETETAIQAKIHHLYQQGLKVAADSPKLAWSHTESWQGGKLLSGLPPPTQSHKPTGDLNVKKTGRGEGTFKPKGRRGFSCLDDCNIHAATRKYCAEQRECLPRVCEDHRTDSTEFSWPPHISI